MQLMEETLLQLLDIDIVDNSRSFIPLPLFPGFYTSQVVQDCGFEAIIISGSGRNFPQLIDRYRML